MVDKRITVDLSAYPDLVVIYLGMRVRRLKGILSLMRIGPKIGRVPGSQPDGLLRHEFLTYGLLPPHIGMRQYWRDFDALEAWARSEPHKIWWQQFVRDTGGTGFWHESYFMGGGMEAVYLDMDVQTGFTAFAPTEEARGTMFSARGRMRREGPAAPPVLDEADVYRDA